MTVSQSQLCQVVFFLVLIAFINKTTAVVGHNRAGQGITDLLSENIPANVEDVNYHKNNITYVPIGVFTSNHSNLVTIRLNENLIADIQDFCFVAVEQVRTIFLGWNRLEVIRVNMFAGLFELVHLALHYNRLHTVEAGSFDHMLQLKALRPDVSHSPHDALGLPECNFSTHLEPQNLPLGFLFLFFFFFL